MELINPLVERYAEEWTSPNEALLNDIYQQTIQTHSHANMISSPVQGRFLSFICSILQPEHVLEVGTFTGYSALCLAQGLPQNGSLHTIELRDDDATIAKKNFSISKYNSQIHLHLGNALEIIPLLDYQWDLVFIDADKISYIQYYEMVLPRLSARGIIIADNVLFHGQVLEETLKGKNAKAIQEFNQHVANDSRTDQVLLTLRDGLLLIKKKK